MLNFDEFRAIQYYKSLGLNRNQVATRMSVSHNTVTRYWNLTDDDYHSMVAEIKEKKSRSRKK